MSASPFFFVEPWGELARLSPWNTSYLYILIMPGSAVKCSNFGWEINYSSDA